MAPQQPQPQPGENVEKPTSLPLLKRIFLHPGTILMALGIPSGYTAYRDYSTNIDTVVARAVRKRGLEQVSDRQIASIVASRALGVATRGCFGVAAVIVSLCTFATGCSTLPETLRATQTWAKTNQERLMASMGLLGTGSDHPDALATKNMSEEEELAYLKRKYSSPGSDSKPPPR